ncbi:MAG: hypothetical protein KGJ41_10095 [Rhodospirillales bacterium]|nr:hypothetical protein [Rhodospirillales bacterium]MDE2199362.1 hypothetical protein [Rhodospirillales bacterium]
MTARKLAPFALAALLALGATGGVALANARNDEGNDAASLANAKVSLVQAIAIAEQQAGGHAVGAGVNNENGRVSIAVDVAAANGVRTVLIDPATGQVAADHAGGDHNEESD